MDLKNAVAVCLISLFSATIVVLIARTLDLHAASQLEPSLVKIAAELEAIRKQGGGLAVQGDTASQTELSDGLIVYYFHGKQRCPSCRAIESQAYDVVRKDFAGPLADGKIAWEVINYEKPGAAAMAKMFDVQMAVVVLAKMNQGRIERWKRLDEVWGLYDDPPKFAAFVRQEISDMLASAAGDRAAPGVHSGDVSAPGPAETSPSSPLRTPAGIPTPMEEPAAGLPLPRIPIPE